MSLDLKIGNAVKIAGTAAGGANIDSFCSFWLGYHFTVAQGTGIVNIDGAYAAVYCSHDSSRPVAGQGKNGPRLNDFKGTEAVEIKDRGGNVLVMNSLIYVAAEDIETANQAMQLHVFRFDPTHKNGVAKWVNDSGWKATPLPAANMTADTKPFLKRRLTFAGGARYCHHTWRHRTSAGLRSVAVGMPFGAKSLFQHCLASHGKALPALQISATGDPQGKAPDAERWSESIDVNNLVLGVDAHGVAVIAHGAFTALCPTDMGSKRWTGWNEDGQPIPGLIDPNNSFELCRELMSVASEGSPRPHTLSSFASHAANCVVPPSNDTPHEFVCIRFQ